MTRSQAVPDCLTLPSQLSSPFIPFSAVHRAVKWSAPEPLSASYHFDPTFSSTPRRSEPSPSLPACPVLPPITTVNGTRRTLSTRTDSLFPSLLNSLPFRPIVRTDKLISHRRRHLVINIDIASITAPASTPPSIALPPHMGLLNPTIVNSRASLLAFLTLRYHTLKQRIRPRRSTS